MQYAEQLITRQFHRIVMSARQDVCDSNFAVMLTYVLTGTSEEAASHASTWFVSTSFNSAFYRGSFCGKNHLL